MAPKKWLDFEFFNCSIISHRWSFFCCKQIISSSKLRSNEQKLNLSADNMRGIVECFQGIFRKTPTHTYQNKTQSSYYLRLQKQYNLYFGNSFDFVSSGRANICHLASILISIKVAIKRFHAKSFTDEFISPRPNYCSL